MMIEPGQTAISGTIPGDQIGQARRLLDAIFTAPDLDAFIASSVLTVAYVLDGLYQPGPPPPLPQPTPSTDVRRDLQRVVELLNDEADKPAPPRHTIPVTLAIRELRQAIADLRPDPGGTDE